MINKVVLVLLFFFGLLVSSCNRNEPDTCPANTRKSDYKITGSFLGNGTKVQLTHAFLDWTNNSEAWIGLDTDTCNITVLGVQLKTLTLDDTVFFDGVGTKPRIRIGDQNGDALYPPFLVDAAGGGYAYIGKLADDSYRLAVNALLLPDGGLPEAPFNGVLYDSLAIELDLLLFK